MGTIYRFISHPEKPSEVLAWFRGLPEPPVERPADRSTVLYFKSAGPLVERTDGGIDASASPVATVFLPRVRRGVIWTVGEVHFLSTPLRPRFPKLHEVSATFSKWLSAQECVFLNTSTAANRFNYYLEGSVRNYDPPVFAFTTGLDAFADGQYFIGDDDNDHVLDKLCRTLRLRGIHCTEA